MKPLQLSSSSLAILIATFLIFLSGCSDGRKNLISPAGIEPFFYDDGNRAALAETIDAHIDFLKKKQLPPYRHETGSISTHQIVATLEKFQALLQKKLSPFLLNTAINKEFSIFQAGGRAQRDRGEMLVTGYYEPLFEGSLQFDPPYIHPLYRKPDDLQVRGTEVGRVDRRGTFLPYWTRKQIETLGPLTGYEIAYLKDPFEAFLLHIQGSGKIRLPDGRIRSIQYRANNGHAYSSIGKLLVDEGKLSLKQADLPGIRRYIQTHPHEMKRILHHNKRFIFFGLSDEESPRGSLGKSLTAERSIATDPRSLPPGALCYLITRSPEVDKDGQVMSWKVLQRFVISDDSGSAIKGPGRVDLFWGRGDYAEAAAGAMRERGKLFILLARGVGESEQKRDTGVGN